MGPPAGSCSGCHQDATRDFTYVIVPSVTFEVAFKVRKGMKEATFQGPGTFVDEE